GLQTLRGPAKSAQRQGGSHARRGDLALGSRRADRRGMQLSRFEHGAVVAELGESAATAARRMRDFRVGCVVVVRDCRPVGILTDRDLAIRVVAAGLDPEKTLVSEI